jgi:2-polyprenyl-3-methyl-5-hydroxy-6-metoxy-1,4-benzoquinol methylase
MAGSPLHEAIWASLPEELEPPHLELRAAFALEHVAAGDRVLDVGCGDGRITERLLAAGAVVTALDVAEEALRRARRRCPDARLLRADEHGDWALADGEFDVVWCGETLEHVADTDALLAEIRRVLRPRGGLAVAVPDLGPLALGAMALWPPYAARRLDPRSDELHAYTARSLRSVLTGAGFAITAIRGAGGLPGMRAQLLASARKA